MLNAGLKEFEMKRLIPILMFFYATHGLANKYQFIKECETKYSVKATCEALQKDRVTHYYAKLSGDLPSLSEVYDVYSKGEYSISLKNSQITDISPLRFFNKTKRVYLYDNDIRDISALSEYKDLEELAIFGNNISDLSPLRGLLKLTELSAGSNNIKDISALSGLKKLVSLHLSNNKVTDLSPLSGLSELKTVIVEQNEIYSLAPLANKIKLRELKASWNNISDLSPINGLNLSNLEIGMNLLDDVEGLPSGCMFTPNQHQRWAEVCLIKALNGDDVSLELLEKASSRVFSFDDFILAHNLALWGMRSGSLSGWRNSNPAEFKNKVMHLLYEKISELETISETDRNLVDQVAIATENSGVMDHAAVLLPLSSPFSVAKPSVTHKVLEKLKVVMKVYQSQQEQKLGKQNETLLSSTLSLLMLVDHDLSFDKVLADLSSPEAAVKIALKVSEKYGKMSSIGQASRNLIRKAAESVNELPKKMDYMQLDSLIDALELWASEHNSGDFTPAWKHQVAIASQFILGVDEPLYEAQDDNGFSDDEDNGFSDDEEDDDIFSLIDQRDIEKVQLILDQLDSRDSVNRFFIDNKLQNLNPLKYAIQKKELVFVKVFGKKALEFSLITQRQFDRYTKAAS